MKVVVRCEKCGHPAPQRAEGKRCANCDHPFGKPAGIDRRLDGKAAYRQMWFSMLVHIEMERGYNKRWAEVTFGERFGSWPEGLVREPALPNPDVVYWVQNRNRVFRASGEVRKKERKERRKQHDLDKRRHEESVARLSKEQRKALGFDIASPQKGRNPVKPRQGRTSRRAPEKM